MGTQWKKWAKFTKRDRNPRWLCWRCERRRTMELTKEMWAVMSPNLPDVSSILVKRVLASIPEPGALTEGEWRVVENGVDRPTLRKLSSILASRPAPAPAPALCHCYVDAPPHTHEPIPESATMQERFIAADAGCTVEEVRQAFAEPIPQYDAAVVGEMQQAYIRGTQSPMHIACTTDSCCTAGMESALAVARRGMVTLEAVEKAVRFEYAAPRLLTTVDIFTHAVLARLAQDGKPHTYTGKVPYLDEVVTLRALVERLYEALEGALSFQTKTQRSSAAALIAARKDVKL